MPVLPSPTVTTAQANRMLAAWGSEQAYMDWLVRSIKEFVLAEESKDIEEEFAAAKEERLRLLRESLGL